MPRDRGTRRSPDTAAGAELCIRAIRTLAGRSLWSSRPVTRLDLSSHGLGETTTADVPGLMVRFVSAFPGLREHACPPGQRGGFVEQLVAGTHAAHLVEHVALELQRLVGDDVRRGVTRPADEAGSHVVVVEHAHAAVGRVAAERATALVSGAFTGRSLRVRSALGALDAAAQHPDDPPPEATVACVVCGPGDPVAVAEAWRSKGIDVVALEPATLVERGLPYAHARVTVVMSVAPETLPPHFGAGPTRLFAVLVDALTPDGTLVCPEGATALRAYARERGHRVVAFAPGEDVAERVGRLAARLPR